MATKQSINQAGYFLIGKKSKLSKDEAYDVLKDFRFIHKHAMTLFRKLIDKKLKSNKLNAIVSQRLKRIPSIIKKLEILTEMKLSRMQDIGGLRIVLNNIEEVNLMREKIKKEESHIDFSFTFANEKNYIKNPADSGYRGIHLIYKYDKNISSDNQCRVEIQIRTKLQHSWATAVEVMGTYLNQPLKQSFGDKEYLDIFKKINTLFISLENKDINSKLIKKVKENINKIELLKKLASFNIASKYLENNDEWQYILLNMNFKNKSIQISKYSEDKFKQANIDYLAMELENLKQKSVEVVLISIKNIKQLKQAYPNYFMDTKKFVKNMEHLFKLDEENDKMIKLMNRLGSKEEVSMAKKMSTNITKKMLNYFIGE